MEKLVGLGADGASVNNGDKSSVKTKLREEMPWLIFGWCMAHKLELGIKDALKGTFFDEVDEMLLRLYYLYKRSPKKLRELQEIHDLVKESMEYDDTGVKPVRANGTRWVAHRVAAMKKVLDKFDVYMVHLESLCNDASYSTKDRAKFQGYFKKWNSTEMLLNIAYYIDILEPIRLLSITFQKSDIDVVKSARALSNVQRDIRRMKTRTISRFPSVAMTQRNIALKEGREIYKGSFVVKNMDDQCRKINEKKENEIEKISQATMSRLQEEQESFLTDICDILDTECWLRTNESKEEELEFADDGVINMFKRFETPLKKAGLSCNEAEILQQWHDLISYANKNLSAPNVPYRITWRRIFDSSRAQVDFKDILLIAEICFCLPCSTAALERAFSRMKRLKTNLRCAIGESRLENIMRIGESGVPIEQFNAKPFVSAWAEGKLRRPNQKSRRKYKQRIKKANNNEWSSSESEFEGFDLSDVENEIKKIS